MHGASRGPHPVEAGPPLACRAGRPFAETLAMNASLPSSAPGRPARWGVYVRLLGALPLFLLSGCGMALFTPQGAIGDQEKNLILIALGLMLLVVIPVIGLTLYFAWRYRASNAQATYKPEWAHSTRIEIVVWSIPCVIVAILAVLIWRTTHTLDPYRPLDAKVAPVRVEVVALNWKWLFIYPDYGVASVNQLAIPVDTPIDFKLTADSLMNSFFIPQLGSQVYAMAGMQTQLHLIADHPGRYRGLSSAFSGPGFSDMHFQVVATDRQAFDAWIKQARHSPLVLDQTTYQALAAPSSKNPVTLYTGATPELFGQIVNRYMHAPKGSDRAMSDGMRGGMAGDMSSPAMRMPRTTPTTAQASE
jgi:cytochrome o ubiquinol oxidase subunit 2